MPRQQMQAQIAEHVRLARGDDRWDGTDALIAAGIVREAVEPYAAQREAALIAAAARERESFEAERAALRRVIAEKDAEIASATRLIARLQMPAAVTA